MKRSCKKLSVSQESDLRDSVAMDTMGHFLSKGKKFDVSVSAAYNIAEQFIEYRNTRYNPVEDDCGCKGKSSQVPNKVLKPLASNKPVNSYKKKPISIWHKAIAVIMILIVSYVIMNTLISIFYYIFGI